MRQQITLLDVQTFMQHLTQMPVLVKTDIPTESPLINPCQ